MKKIFTRNLLFLFATFLAILSNAQDTVTSRYVMDQKSLTLTSKPSLYNYALQNGGKIQLLTSEDVTFKLKATQLLADMKLAVVNKNNTYKWVSNFDTIRVTYQNGAVNYLLKDKIIGNGLLEISALSGLESVGAIIKVNSKLIARNTSLCMLLKNNIINENSNTLIIEKNQIKLNEVAAIHLPKTMDIEMKAVGFWENPLSKDTLKLDQKSNLIMGIMPFAFNPEVYFLFDKSAITPPEDNQKKQKAIFDNAFKNNINAQQNLVLNAPNVALNTLYSQLNIILSHFPKDSVSTIQQAVSIGNSYAMLGLPSSGELSYTSINPLTIEKLATNIPLSQLYLNNSNWNNEPTNVVALSNLMQIINQQEQQLVVDSNKLLEIVKNEYGDTIANGYFLTTNIDNYINKSLYQKFVGGNKYQSLDQQMNQILAQFWKPDLGVFEAYSSVLNTDNYNGFSWNSLSYPILYEVGDTAQKSQNLMMIANDLNNFNSTASIKFFQAKPTEILQVIRALYEINQPKLAFDLFNQYVKNQTVNTLSPFDFSNKNKEQDALIIQEYYKILIEHILGYQLKFLENKVIIKPQIPNEWDNLNLKSKKIEFKYAKEKLKQTYTYNSSFFNKQKTEFILNITNTNIDKILVNGTKVDYRWLVGINTPQIKFTVNPTTNIKVECYYSQVDSLVPITSTKWSVEDHPTIDFLDWTIQEVKVADKDQLAYTIAGNQLKLVLDNATHDQVIQVLLQKNNVTYWKFIPINLKNNRNLMEVVNMQVTDQTPLNLYNFFNKKLSDINPLIHDQGLRKLAYPSNYVKLNDGLNFRTPTDINSKNAVLLNQKSKITALNVPVDGVGKAMAILLTGINSVYQYNTNNAAITILYTDNSQSITNLSSATIFPNLYNDVPNRTFEKYVKRLHLKSGKLYNGLAPLNVYKDNNVNEDYQIDGGAASLYYIKLDPFKRVKSINISLLSDDITLGVLGITLVKDFNNLTQNETVDNSQKNLLMLANSNDKNAKEWEFMMSEGAKSNYWSSISVPYNWELKGFGAYNNGFDKLINGPNYKYAKEIGTYRNRFTIPKEWTNKELIINFEGVMTDATVWVNNQLVGKKHQGGFEAFKYNITPFVKMDEENLLEIRVEKQSDNQSINNAESRSNNWVLGGIYNDVWIEAVPKMHIESVKLNATANGNIHVVTQIENIEPNTYLELSILDLSGAVLTTKNMALNPSIQIQEGDLTVNNPKLWNAETPNLYQFVARVKKAQQYIQDWKMNFGFRDIAINNEKGLTINGKSLKIKGVNYAPFSTTTGYMMNDSALMSDLNKIKQMNFNAIRSVNGTLNSRIVSICDAIGLYVINGLSATNEGGYDLETSIDKIEKLLSQQQSHPSIILWDLKNKTGYNSKLLSTIYNQDMGKRTVIVADTLINGINTKEYLSVADLEKSAMDGYLQLPTAILNARGDGGGAAGLSAYWNKTIENKNIVGFFINEFSDKGIVRTDQFGRIDELAGYAANGIVSNDRETDGSYWAIRDILSPIQISVDMLNFTGNIEVRNFYDYINLNACQLSWELQTVPAPFENGIGATTIKKDFIRIKSIQPGAVAKVDLRLPSDYNNYDVLVIKAYDPYGNTISKWNYKLPNHQQVVNKYLKKSGPNPVSLTYKEDNILLSNGNVQLAINKTSGKLEQVVNGNKFNFTNGPVLVNENSILKDITTSKTDSTQSIEMRYYGNLQSVKWTMFASGWVEMDYAYKVVSETESAGISFDMPEYNLLSFKWLGSGFDRIYKNRNQGQSIAVWENYTFGQTEKIKNNIPEFKGYFGNVNWAVFKTTEGVITTLIPDEQVNLRMYNICPITGIDCKYYHQQGNISFMDQIPAIQYQLPNQLFGMKEATNTNINHNISDKEYKHKIYFYFGIMP